jgi:predicted RNA-binding Zn-ribbon protein involved in translation (DUF1610 family)
MINKEVILSMIISAQGGDKLTENDLLEYIRVKEMPRRVGRYINRNRQADNDDVKQEFLIGVAGAIQGAKLDVGDPIEYIMNQGMYRVRSYVRRSIIQGTIQVCDECGHKSRLNKVGDHYECKKCGSHKITTSELNDNNEVTLYNIVDKSGFEDDTLSEMIVNDFKDTLTPGTNTYKLFEMIMEQGMDRDNPLVKNYMKEIAKVWGGCSTQNISINLKKLQAQFQKYSESKGIDLIATC